MEIQADMVRFTLMALGLIVLFLTLLFRRAGGVVLPLIVAVLSVLTTVSIMAAIGMPVTFADEQRIGLHVLVVDEQRLDMSPHVESPALADGEEVGARMRSNLPGLTEIECG